MVSSVFKAVFKRFQDRRRAERITDVPLVAYYWDGGAPQPHRVRDISKSGVYLITDERWYLGTMLQLTIDLHVGYATTQAANMQLESTVVWSKVVRHDIDGVGFEFLLGKFSDRKKMTDLVENARQHC